MAPLRMFCFRRYWRYHLSVASHGLGKIPDILSRGWRPSSSFSQSNPEDKTWGRYRQLDFLHARKPNFFWAHPFAIFLSNTPGVVSRSEIRDSVLGCLQTLRGQSYKPLIDIVALTPHDPNKIWKAAVFLCNKVDYDFLLKKAKGTEGIKLKCSKRIDWVDERIKGAKTQLDETVAANRVHPCATNSQNEQKAKKEYKTANLGLRIFGKEGSDDHVCCSKALGLVRGVGSSSNKMFAIAMQQIKESTNVLLVNRSEIDKKERELKHLAKRMESGIGDQVSNLTTFQTLQALKSNQGEQTACPICFECLGGNEGNKLVALTRCGHLCCKGCMMNWMREKSRSSVQPSCLECRKPISQNQLVFVDPRKAGDDERFKERQAQAKTLLQTAATMLNDNHGQLSPDLWEALYLSMDLPSNVSHAAHSVFTAIPSRVLAHLRHATAMPLNCGKKQPGDMGYYLSSKLRALLSDLPRDELSVVFASSKVAVQHLLTVLEKEGIDCRGLFTGQSEKESEIAVSEWHSIDSVIVLVVQAGAAACGLTLTAASRMFLMDPFLKHEEEKQAYARLHRYGQAKPVFCKVYFSPTSVESRLLEWRHRRGEQSTVEEQEETKIFAPLRDAICIDDDEARDISQDEDEDSDNVETKQTQFLLGLQ